MPTQTVYIHSLSTSSTGTLGTASNPYRSAWQWKTQATVGFDAQSDADWELVVGGPQYLFKTTARPGPVPLTFTGKTTKRIIIRDWVPASAGGTDPEYPTMGTWPTAYYPAHFYGIANGGSGGSPMTLALSPYDIDGNTGDTFIGESQAIYSAGETVRVPAFVVVSQRKQDGNAYLGGAYQPGGLFLPVDVVATAPTTTSDQNNPQVQKGRAAFCTADNKLYVNIIGLPTGYELTWIHSGEGAFQIAGADYIELRGIGASHFYSTNAAYGGRPFGLFDGKQLVATDCRLGFAGNHALTLSNALTLNVSNCVVRGCTFFGIGGSSNGIQSVIFDMGSGTGTTLSNVTMERNRFLMAMPVKLDGTPIGTNSQADLITFASYASGCTVTGCTVTDTEVIGGEGAGPDKIYLVQAANCPAESDRLTASTYPIATKNWKVTGVGKVIPGYLWSGGANGDYRVSFDGLTVDASRFGREVQRRTVANGGSAAPLDAVIELEPIGTNASTVRFRALINNLKLTADTAGVRDNHPLRLIGSAVTGPAADRNEIILRGTGYAVLLDNGVRIDPRNVPTHDTGVFGWTSATGVSDGNFSLDVSGMKFALDQTIPAVLGTNKPALTGTRHLATGLSGAAANFVGSVLKLAGSTYVNVAGTISGITGATTKATWTSVVEPGSTFVDKDAGVALSDLTTVTVTVSGGGGSSSWGEM